MDRTYLYRWVVIDNVRIKVDFFKTCTIIPVVNHFGTYAVDSIQVYEDANREQSASEFPIIRCSVYIEQYQ